MTKRPSDWRLPVATTLSLCATVGLLFASATAASAYSTEVRKKCRADYFRYCAGYAVPSEQLTSCMEAERHRLSPGCKVALAQDGDVPDRYLTKKD